MFLSLVAGSPNNFLWAKVLSRAYRTLCLSRLACSSRRNGRDERETASLTSWSRTPTSLRTTTRIHQRKTEAQGFTSSSKLYLERLRIQRIRYNCDGGRAAGGEGILVRATGRGKASCALQPHQLLAEPRTFTLFLASHTLVAFIYLS